MLAFFESIALVEANDPAAEVLVPLLKIEISKAATDAIRRARLIIGGNAVIRDFSILPRLAEDALVQEIWEGTHAILAGHVLRALKRPASQKSFIALALPPEGTHGPAADQARDASRQLGEMLGALGPGSADERAGEGLRLGALAWQALLPSLLLRESAGPLDPDGAFGRFAGVA